VPRLTPFLSVVSSIVSLSCLACAGASGASAGYPHGRVDSDYAPSATTSSTSSSSSSSSIGAPYGTADAVMRPADVPTRRGAPPVVALVVRPDVLEVELALRTVVDEPELGVRILGEATSAIEKRFGEIIPKGALQVRMRATSTERAANAKGKVVTGKEASPREPTAVHVDGRIVVALSATQDYWERSRLVARMKALADRIASSESAEAPRFAVTFGRIEPHVRAPETSRAELAQRWATHHKQAAREVQAGDAVLAREVCAPAAQVVERVVSLEEIELTLPIECRRAE
jgi:hypothetical protein